MTRRKGSASVVGQRNIGGQVLEALQTQTLRTST
jgi:hypothetical protein